MSRQPPRPTKAQVAALLKKELDRLVTIDEQRNVHTAALQALQSKRDVQVGRMQVIAEQASVDLEQFVGDELTRRASGKERQP